MVLLHAALTMMVVSGAGQAVLLDFDRDWCPPCRAMDPTIQALMQKGYPVRRVNADREPSVVQQYGVTGTPCFVMTVDGREIDRVVGGTTFSRLERMCKAGLAQGQAPPTSQNMPGSGGPLVSAPPMQNAAASPGLSATPVSLPPAAESMGSDEALVAASVRLRIEDAAGHSCGSGTIIDARGGKALILTCGHIFRDSKGRGQIEVDLFGPYAGRRVPGELVDYDVERDVGLVCIVTPGPVAATPVAPAGYRIGQGEPVVSVGCNNGSFPTAVRSRVMSLDKFLGPPNIQVAGQPVEGRSGGGLFSHDGLVIGVCNAADPSDREGFFAALPSIHALLDRAKLSFVYKREADSAVAQAAPVPRGMLVPVELPSLPRQMPSPLGAAGAHPLPAAAGVAATGDSPRLRPEERAALDEIRRRLQEGAEVVCVVRSRHDPQAKSEVIMLDQVSPEFIKQLAASPRSQQPRHLTSLEIPRQPPPAGNAAAAPTGSATSGAAAAGALMRR